MVLSTLLQNRVVLFPTSEPHGPLSIYLLQSLVVLPFTSEPRGLLLLSPKTLWSSLLLWSRMVAPSLWLPHLGFKSPRQSSSAAPFPTPPTVGYTGLHSYILPALLGCHSKSRQAWPHGMEPIISKLSHRHCNQGELLPSYILG